MAWSLISAARSLLKTCTGYDLAPTWQIEAEQKQAALLKHRDTAVKAAAAAGKLRERHGVAQGLTGLAAALGVATALEAEARIARNEAGQLDGQIEKLLKANGAGDSVLGRNAASLEASQEALADVSAVVKTLGGARGAMGEWEALRGRLEGGIAVRLQAATVAKGATAAEALSLEHARLRQALESVVAGKWDQKKVTEAVSQVRSGVGDLEQGLAGLEGGSGTVVDLVALRKAAMGRFLAVAGSYGLDEVRTALVERLGEEDGRVRKQHLVGLRSGVEAEQERLAQAMKAADSPAAIGRALEEALRAYREGAARFAEKVQGADGLGEARELAQAAVVAQQQEAAYERMRATVTEALRELRLAGAPAYGTLLGQYDVIVEATGRNRKWERAAEVTLPALVERIDQAFTEHMDETAPKLKERRGEVERLQKSLAEAAKTATGPGAARVLAAIAANLQDAENFLDCVGNIEAAEPSIALVADAKAMLEDIGNASGAFATLAKRLAGIGTALEAKKLDVLPEKGLAGLRGRLKGLKGAPDGGSLAEFKAGVEGLEADVAGQAGFADTLASWRVEAEKVLGPLEEQYKEYAAAVTQSTAFPQGKPDPATGLAKTALDGMRALWTARVGLEGFSEHGAKWDLLLHTATDGLAAAWDHSTKTLDPAAAQKDVAEALAKEQAVVDVTRRWTALTRTAGQLGSGIAAAKGDVAEHALLVRQLAAMQAGLGDAPEQAGLELDDIEARLNRLPGTPDFSKAIARAIGEVPGQWRAVLARVETRLQELGAAVAVASGAENTRLEAILGGAAKRFAADAFDGVAQALAAPDPGGAQQGKRRAEREAGLRVLRAYREGLLTDPLIQHVQMNPFGVAMFGDMFRFLDRVELEFVRAAA